MVGMAVGSSVGAGAIIGRAVGEGSRLIGCSITTSGEESGGGHYLTLRRF